MVKFIERLGDRMLGAVLPTETAHASICYGLPIGQCGWICCNTRCTVEKKCCLPYGGSCVCSSCQHS
jgi:hypothetical protein